MEGSRRPESADGCVDVQEVGEVQRSLTGFDGEPVKLLKNRSDVVNGGGSGDDAGGRVLNQLMSFLSVCYSHHKYLIVCAHIKKQLEPHSFSFYSEL